MCLRNHFFIDDRPRGVSPQEFLDCILRRTQSKTDIAVNTVATPLSKRPKISRYTSVVELRKSSLDNSTLTERDKKRIAASSTSKNIQTTSNVKNISLNAGVCKRAVEKETQKTEKIFFKSMEDKATQMFDYFTLSDLHCVEWMHKNLMEIHLNPFHVVQDEKIRDVSELTCYTSELS